MNDLKLKKVDVENLILNENAYFYKKTQDIGSRDIRMFFNEALVDKSAKSKFKPIIQQPIIGDDEIELGKYSLDIFEFQTKPTFLKKYDKDLVEKKFGLYLIVEIEQYIGLIRRNVSGTKIFKNFAEGIDYEVLSRFLLTEKSRFEKIESNSMNTSEEALQRKVSEAKNLQGVYSRFSASKEILNSIRLDDDEGKHSIALNTSRVNSFNLKSTFDEIVKWIILTLELVDKAYAAPPQNTFLDGFAKPIKFESVIKTLQPTYLLIRFASLLEEMDQGNIVRAFIVDDNKDELEIELTLVVSENRNLIKLQKVGDKYEGDGFGLKINKNNIAINNKDFTKIYIEFEGGYSISLNKYLNIGNHFIINFDKIEYVYTNRKIFRDSKLLENLDHFFETFIPRLELKNIISEKGSYDETSTKFTEDSIFGFIENIEAKDSKLLICDDMGTEWGDFIAANETDITFYHAKYHTEGLSASDLEEVFGQAQKNLGTLELNDELIDVRRDRWLRNYKKDKVLTKIPRIRKCPLGTDKIQIIKDFINTTSSNPRVSRKVYVVINFISKDKLEKAITRLKKGDNFKNKAVILQILWYVNSMMSVALDRNVDFRILCQP